MVGNTMMLDNFRIFWKLDSFGINVECNKHSQNNEIIKILKKNYSLKMSNANLNHCRIQPQKSLEIILNCKKALSH